jgi:nucleotide-binding universal stress UspA family protein
MFNKILVALDHADKSQFVLDEAKYLAICTRAQVLLLYVLNPTEERMKQAAHLPQASEQEEMAVLRLLAQPLVDAGISTESKQVEGDPGRVICQMAEDWQADVIIMGRRGRSGMRELLLGSVSNYVLHHAPCSVLTVQGKTVRTDDEALQQYLDTF